MTLEKELDCLIGIAEGFGAGSAEIKSTYKGYSYTIKVKKNNGQTTD